MEWQKYFETMEEQLYSFSKFKVDFLTESDFNGIITHLQNPKIQWYKNYGIQLSDKRQIYVTGFFGAQIAEVLIQAVKANSEVKIITEHRRPDIFRMYEGGVDVRFNGDIHTRMFIVFREVREVLEGVLILGSFDFDERGIGGNRRDAGIITRNPDLLRSAIEYFETVWEDRHKSKPVKKKNGSASVNTRARDTENKIERVLQNITSFEKNVTLFDRYGNPYVIDYVVPSAQSHKYLIKLKRNTRYSDVFPTGRDLRELGEIIILIGDLSDIHVTTRNQLLADWHHVIDIRNIDELVTIIQINGNNIK